MTTQGTPSSEACGSCGQPELPDDEDPRGHTELRPYGPGDALICHDCATRPENQAGVNLQLKAALEATMDASTIGGANVGHVMLTRRGPRPLRPHSSKTGELLRSRVTSLDEPRQLTRIEILGHRGTERHARGRRDDVKSHHARVARMSTDDLRTMATNPKTNEQRCADKELGRRERRPQNGALVQLGTWLYCHDDDMPGAPVELLLAASRQLTHRLDVASTRPQNARTRKKIRWLARWSRRVQDELARREHAAN